MSDPYVDMATKMERLQRIADAAEEFIRARCALEDLVSRHGVNAAMSTALADSVEALRMKLEQLVLGDERVPGRRSP